METFAQKAIHFHQHLNLELPGSEVEVLNPFRENTVIELIKEFYLKYFSDHQPRTFLIGINPGRFGAGITGIAFTDPVYLQDNCGIHNPFDKKHELSSQFIYQVIEAYGGAKKFYSRFFITAVSPLGFTKNGKNINYYDEKELMQSLEPFITQTMIEQLKLGAFQKTAICIGGGKNYTFLTKLNQALNLFDEIIPLDHPRFVMQYRRKSINQYVKKYLDALKNCELSNIP